MDMPAALFDIDSSSAAVPKQAKNRSSGSGIVAELYTSFIHAETHGI
jgi:hypothetical protein